jgi:hypothetical protein
MKAIWLRAVTHDASSSILDIHRATKQMLIARKNPKCEKVSHDFTTG